MKESQLRNEGVFFIWRVYLLEQVRLSTKPRQRRKKEAVLRGDPLGRRALICDWGGETKFSGIGTLINKATFKGENEMHIVRRPIRKEEALNINVIYNFIYPQSESARYLLEVFCFPCFPRHALLQHCQNQPRFFRRIQRLSKEAFVILRSVSF